MFPRNGGVCMFVPNIPSGAASPPTHPHPASVGADRCPTGGTGRPHPAFRGSLRTALVLRRPADVRGVRPTGRRWGDERATGVVGSGQRSPHWRGCSRLRGPSGLGRKRCGGERVRAGARLCTSIRLRVCPRVCAQRGAGGGGERGRFCSGWLPASPAPFPLGLLLAPARILSQAAGAAPSPQPRPRPPPTPGVEAAAPRRAQPSRPWEEGSASPGSAPLRAPSRGHAAPLFPRYERCASPRRPPRSLSTSWGLRAAPLRVPPRPAVGRGWRRERRHRKAPRLYSTTLRCPGHGEGVGGDGGPLRAGTGIPAADCGAPRPGRPGGQPPRLRGAR